MDSKEGDTIGNMTEAPFNLRRGGPMTSEEQLAQLGHKQELQRSFSLPSLVGLCLCLMATWEALSSVIVAALASGGPPCLFYN
jgi:hypothetical protein